MALKDMTKNLNNLEKAILGFSIVILFLLGTGSFGVHEWEVILMAIATCFCCVGYIDRKNRQMLKNIKRWGYAIAVSWVLTLTTVFHVLQQAPSG